MLRFTAIAAAAGLAFSAGAAPAQTDPGPVLQQTPAPNGVKLKNGIWLDPYNMPLYYSDRDEENWSHCDDACAHAWPPLYAAEEAEGYGDWKPLTREDGYRQWAYKGHPLYTWRRDTPGEPGAGHSEPGWHLARE